MGGVVGGEAWHNIGQCSLYVGSCSARPLHILESCPHSIAPPTHPPIVVPTPVAPPTFRHNCCKIVSLVVPRDLLHCLERQREREGGEEEHQEEHQLQE